MYTEKYRRNDQLDRGCVVYSYPFIIGLQIMVPSYKNTLKRLLKIIFHHTTNNVETKKNAAKTILINMSTDEINTGIALNMEKYIRITK